MSRHYQWDDYFWPGTTVLANKLGITDRDRLATSEYVLAAIRQGEIIRGEVSIPRTFDAAHAAAVHAHLFGDVYEWAGQWRTVDMFKGNTGFAEVPREVQAQFADAAQVARSTDWARVDRGGFVTGAARFYAHFNHAHGFREGNGRTGKLVVDQLAERSAFRVQWDQVSPAWWNHANAMSHHSPGAARTRPRWSRCSRR